MFGSYYGKQGVKVCSLLLYMFLRSFIWLFKYFFFSCRVGHSLYFSAVMVKVGGVIKMVNLDLVLQRTHLCHKKF